MRSCRLFSTVYRSYIPVLFASVLACPPASAALVISQVYGGGGNTGATYTHDFVELFNFAESPIGSAVVLDGLSIQYASAAGTGNFGANVSMMFELTGSLAPDQYYLIQLAPGSGGTTPLPQPDLVGTSINGLINMSATSGKVALVQGTDPLGCNGGSDACSPTELDRIIDLVGYGNANFFEGTGPAPTASNTLSVFRVLDGGQDTDNNAGDFIVGSPNPRNSSFRADSVPEPATLALFGIAVAVLGFSRRKRGTN